MPYTITEACNGCGACVRICPVDAISGEKKAVQVVDASLCIECGVCGRICPKEAVLDAAGKKCAPVKRSMWKKPVFNRKTCMSCNICIEGCPASCIALEEPEGRKNLHGYPYLKNEKACIACGFCSEECPVDCITMVEPEQKEAKPAKAEGDSAAA